MNRYGMIVAVLAGLLFSTQTFGWGATGHRIVAQIGEDNLSPEALASVREIIGERNLLAELSTWPDEIRSDSQVWGYTAPWHYISIDDDEVFGPELPRSESGDILWALENFEKVLRDDTVSREEKWQALAFYTHFVGDIHQPLHVGNRKDRGGNLVKVEYFGAPSNLHSVWDTQMISTVGLSYTEYVAFIDDVSVEQIRRWQANNYVEWAQESKALRPQVYALEFDVDGAPDLNYIYVYWNRATMDQRLRQAGYRLAGQLNAIFAEE